MGKPNSLNISALSIAQPWAQCVIQHGKNVENKKANLKKRGTIMIYASSSYQSWRFESVVDDYRLKIAWDDVEKGVILGFVDVVDVVTNKSVQKKTKKWFVPGHSGYVLENPVMLKKPVKAKPPNGAISFWYPSEKILRACLKQVSKRRQKQFRPFA